MRKQLSQRIQTGFACVLFLAGSLPLHAVDSPKSKVCHWISECPYIGLVSNKVAYGPITLKRFDLAHKGRVVIAKPGEKIHGTVDYKVDASELDSLHLHHVVLGIKRENDQICLVHSLGIWDKKGKTHFSIVAPHERGVYEVRFDYQTSSTCDEAIKNWNEAPPSSGATVGIIIVE